MVAQAKDAKLCIITLDTLAVTLPYTRAIRESAVALGFEPHAVMVHSLQNHSAPSCGALMLDPDFPLDLRADQEHITGSEAAYTKQAVTGATRAIQEANDALTPVQVAMGHAVRDDLAFNRRGVMRGGNICMPWALHQRRQTSGADGHRLHGRPCRPTGGCVVRAIGRG